MVYFYKFSHLLGLSSSCIVIGVSCESCRKYVTLYWQYRKEQNLPMSVAVFNGLIRIWFDCCGRNLGTFTKSSDSCSTGKQGYRVLRGHSWYLPYTFCSFWLKVVKKGTRVTWAPHIIASALRHKQKKPWTQTFVFKLASHFCQCVCKVGNWTHRLVSFCSYQ